MLYIEVYVIYKPMCKYKPNQSMDYAVNPWLTMSKTDETEADKSVLALEGELLDYWTMNW